MRNLFDVTADKPATVPKAKIGRRIGAIHADEMQAVDAALARFIGITDS